MKCVAYLVGILLVPVYYVVFAYLFTGLVLALVKLSEFFGVMGPDGCCSTDHGQL
jgi:hypothetical protein